MASLLKLLIDFPCQVFIDYELKGNAEPNQLFKIPLRKGIYVLELKSSDILLYEQEYKMESNEEEDLLRINVKEEDKERVKEKRFWDISSMDVSIREDEGGIFSGKGLYLVNNVTGEEYIVDFYKDELTYDIKYSKEFDACGLFKVSVYRNAINMDYTVLVNKMGKIQIGGYSDIAPFSNKNATIGYRDRNDLFGGYLSTEYYLIDKWNNVISYCKDFDYVDENGFVGDLCIVGKTSKGEFGILCTSYGLIDVEGNIVLECKNSEIVPLASYRKNKFVDAKYLINNSKIVNSKGEVIYEKKPYSPVKYFYYEENNNNDADVYKSFRFIVIEDDKYGILNSDCSFRIIDFIYDSIESLGESYLKIKKDGKYGVLDSNCKVILQCIYDSIESIEGSYYKYQKDGKIGFLDSHFQEIRLKFEYIKSSIDGLIKKKNKYGLVMYSVESNTLKFKDIIPCEYDSYKVDNNRWSKPYLCFFMKSEKDGHFLCDAYIFDYDSQPNTITKLNSFICQDIDTRLSHYNRIVYKNNNKWGILNEVECKYDEIELPSVVSEVLVKENGKWGILYRTECKYDKILCSYGGHFAVIWTENNIKFIGYINNVGFYKREIDKSEVLVDFGFYAGEKPVIFTVVDDGKINPKKNYYNVPRKVYVCRESDNCNKPDELVSIDYALTCNEIWSLRDEYYVENENEVGVKIIMDDWIVKGVFSIKTMSYVKECDCIWDEADTEYVGWKLKYNKLSKKVELYYRDRIVLVNNDFIRIVHYADFNDTIIAAEESGSKWALYDTHNHQLAMPIFTELHWDLGGDDFNLSRFNDDEGDISSWEFCTKNLSKFGYMFPFFEYRYHDGDGNSFEGLSPFKNIRTYIDLLSKPVSDIVDKTEMINDSNILRVAFIVEDDNIGVLTKREFIVGQEMSDENQKNDNPFKPEIINNVTYIDFISYLDLMLEQSDYIIGANTNSALETIRKDIKKVKVADSLYKSKKTSVVDLCDKIDMSMINALTGGCLIDRVQKIHDCYKKTAMV